MNKLSCLSSVYFKKFYLCTILLGTLSFFFSSCNRTKVNTNKTTSSLSVVVTNDSLAADSMLSMRYTYDQFGTRLLHIPPAGLTGKAIEFVADPKVYPDTVTTIKVVLHNQGAGNITTGLEHRLEKYEDGKWHRLDFPNNYIFLSIGLVLEEGQSLEFLTCLYPKENNYTPGWYRVSKKILFKFDTEFVVDSMYQLRMTKGNHSGDAFEMIVPDINSNPGHKIDTLRVIIRNNSSNQELINSNDFSLCLNDGKHFNCLWGKQYSDFTEETYPLGPGQSMEFDIPVMSDKYMMNSGTDHIFFGPGKYTLTKWSKVDLHAEFKLDSGEGI